MYKDKLFNSREMWDHTTQTLTIHEETNKTIDKIRQSFSNSNQSNMFSQLNTSKIQTQTNPILKISKPTS